jgi:hypothetical protein
VAPVFAVREARDSLPLLTRQANTTAPQAAEPNVANDFVMPPRSNSLSPRPTASAAFTKSYAQRAATHPAGHASAPQRVSRNQPPSHVGAALSAPRRVALSTLLRRGPRRPRRHSSTAAALSLVRNSTPSIRERFRPSDRGFRCALPKLALRAPIRGSTTNRTQSRSHAPKCQCLSRCALRGFLALRRRRLGWPAA